jgi:hypothetical protein
MAIHIQPLSGLGQTGSSVTTGSTGGYSIHIQPLSGLGQTGEPVFILSSRVSQKMPQPR